MSVAPFEMEVIPEEDPETRCGTPKTRRVAGIAWCVSLPRRSPLSLARRLPLPLTAPPPPPRALPRLAASARSSSRSS
jgi:hypothetical protein